MGTRRGVCSRSIGDPPRPVSGSVTLDPSSIKRYAGTAMRWLMLLMSLPPTPTRHRVGVWRKLQRMGAVRLRGSAWILPETPETTELFQWLVQEIQSSRGEATLVHVDRIEAMTEEQVGALFHKARGVEYQAVVQGCREILSQLDRYLANHRSVAKLRGTLDGLKRELDRIQAIDYLDTPAGPRARKLWETTATRLRAAETRPRAARGRHRASLPPHGSTWVTRPRPHIDRIASAWPGHHGEDCTFETLVRRFGIKDRRVKVIAEIVHEADLHDGKFTRNESTGVDFAIRGLAASTQEDHELLERGMAIFDGLYTVLKRKT